MGIVSQPFQKQLNPLLLWEGADSDRNLRHCLHLHVWVQWSTFGWSVHSGIFWGDSGHRTHVHQGTSYPQQKIRLPIYGQVFWCFLCGGIVDCWGEGIYSYDFLFHLVPRGISDPFGPDFGCPSAAALLTVYQTLDKKLSYAPAAQGTGNKLATIHKLGNQTQRRVQMRVQSFCGMQGASNCNCWCRHVAQTTISSKIVCHLVTKK